MLFGVCCSLPFVVRSWWLLFVVCRALLVAGRVMFGVVSRCVLFIVCWSLYVVRYCGLLFVVVARCVSLFVVCCSLSLARRWLKFVGHCCLLLITRVVNCCCYMCVVRR